MCHTMLVNVGKEKSDIYRELIDFLLVSHHKQQILLPINTHEANKMSKSSIIYLNKNNF